MALSSSNQRPCPTSVNMTCLDLQVKSQSAMKILSSSAVLQMAAAIARELNPSRIEAPHFALVVVRRPQIRTTGARVRAPSVKAFQPEMR